MNRLKEMLNSDIVRGVVRTATGEVIEFHSPGVKDLFTLVVSRPNALVGATVADRVIGRGAALLLVLGKVERVYASLISSQAVEVFQEAGIRVDYDKMVPNIINRDGSGICPVEKLTMSITDPEVAREKIKEFLISKNIIES
ncbi:MAG: DUF1893 domain-containing protein [Muribaculaceae bacterium]|nr:DUF1893 domain-containing protein [Muribaculaceae bacterium]